MQLKLIGDPIAQKRHRHAKLKNGNVNVYDPLAREKALLKRNIKEAIEHCCKDFELYKTPEILFCFGMNIPKTMLLKKKEIAYQNKLRHCSKPDVDNLVKFYLDCLTGVVIKDDNGVTLGYCQKVYTKEPFTLITIHEMGELVGQESVESDKHGCVVCDGQPISSIHVPPYCEDPKYSKHLPTLGWLNYLSKKVFP